MIQLFPVRLQALRLPYLQKTFTRHFRDAELKSFSFFEKEYIHITSSNYDPYYFQLDTILAFKGELNFEFYDKAAEH